jgi:type I restriction enzyme S subunit
MKEVKFESLFQFQKKSKIKAGDGFNLGEAKYPFYTSSNVLTKSIDEYLFEAESLIFGTGGLASIHFCNEKFAVSTDCFVTQPKNIKDVFSKYVYYYLSGNIHILENGFKGAGLKHISKDYLGNIQIPLPTLPQQHKIANILDAADALRQNDKALIAKYDELTQALFLDMFGDPVSNPKGWKLKEGSKYYEVRGRVGWKGYKKTDLRQSGAIVLGATHINNLGTIDLSKVVFLSQEKYIESPEIMVQKHDLIFVQRGNTIGKIALVRDELGQATINPVVLIFRPINANPFFLLYLLMNKGLNREFVGSNSGSAQPMITQKTMKDFLMIDVPVSLQNQFAERVTLIEEQKSIAQKSLEKSESLFNSLLQKAFKGEIG